MLEKNFHFVRSKNANCIKFFDWDGCHFSIGSYAALYLLIQLEFWSVKLTDFEKNEICLSGGSRSKGLKFSRAELLVPFKRYFNDKANISDKPTSVAFYSLLVYSIVIVSKTRCARRFETSSRRRVVQRS